MSSCTVDRRHRCRSASRDLADLEIVADVTVHQPQDGHLRQWTLQVVLYQTVIPPRVVRVVADAGLGIDPDLTATRGEPPQVELVAVPG